MRRFTSCTLALVLLSPTIAAPRVRFWKKKIMKSGNSGLLLAATAVLAMVGDVNCQEICVTGYIMDKFCIDRGTLLDRSSVRTLEGPEQHSVHCLVDVGVCLNSGFEVLLDPPAGQNTYGRGYALDTAGFNAAVSLARQEGICSTCSGSGTQRNGFRATVKGTVVSSPTANSAGSLAVTSVSSASEGCETATEQDEDECSTGNNNCAANAACSNTAGSFTCACNAGFSGNGVSCTNEDECVLETDSCHANAACTDTQGSFTCSCNAGYSGNGVSCSDVDECSANTHDCNANAECANGDGGFTCSCKSGFILDGGACVDIDECATGADNCLDNHAACVNNDGSFECACADGFSGDGVVKCDDAACAAAVACDEHANCDSDGAGSYTCTCMPGWEGDGAACSNVNECQDDASNNCADMAACTDTDGSFTCACGEGYAGDGVQCVNVNECELETDSCHAFADCMDNDGSYTCTCMPGWEGDGAACSNVNECQDDASNNCADMAACTDTDGSFTCACGEGYAGDGVQCVNVNECELETDSCHAFADCVDSEGSYTCTCTAGYVGDGTDCMPAAAESETTTAVRMVVTMPYSVETFAAEVQASFKQGVAQSTGSTPEQVTIHSVTAIGDVATRRLLQDAVDVDFSVATATEQAAAELVAEGKLSLDTLNQALQGAGVQGISVVKTAPEVQVAQMVGSSSPEPEQESGASSKSSGVVVVLMSVVLCAVLGRGH